MKKRLFPVLALLLSASLILSCGPAPTPAPAPTPNPDQGGDTADTAGVAELADGGNAFAFDLYQLLKAEDGNLFYSPYSISAALAMTYAGARGETEQQMADALHFALGQDHLHPAFRELDRLLASRGEGARGKDGEGFRLNVANALWGQEGYGFLPAYLRLTSDNYGAGLQEIDFAGDPEGARQTINDWASDETEGRIEDLIPSGLIDPLTRLVLTNAIYFNAAWADQFKPEQTTNGPFVLLDGSEITVPMMHQTTSMPYAAGDGYQAVELAYDGKELAMTLVVPEKGRFEAIEETLDAARVDEILDSLGYQKVALSLPRFEFESQFSLKDTLSALGMPDAFAGAADFSGMTGSRELYISEVVHKAFLAVDEAGTEAAAATAVVMPAGAVLQEPVEVTVDRPFILLIRDVETGALLFVGRVVDPGTG